MLVHRPRSGWSLPRTRRRTWPGCMGRLYTTAPGPPNETPTSATGPPHPIRNWPTPHTESTSKVRLRHSYTDPSSRRQLILDLYRLPVWSLKCIESIGKTLHWCRKIWENKSIVLSFKCFFPYALMSVSRQSHVDIGVYLYLYISISHYEPLLVSMRCKYWLCYRYFQRASRQRQSSRQRVQRHLARKMNNTISTLPPGGSSKWLMEVCRFWLA